MSDMNMAVNQNPLTIKMNVSGSFSNGGLKITKITLTDFTEAFALDDGFYYLNENVTFEYVNDFDNSNQSGTAYGIIYVADGVIDLYCIESMMYYENEIIKASPLDSVNLEYLKDALSEIHILSGDTAPTTSTYGEIGQLYMMNVNPYSLYYCYSISSVPLIGDSYNWKQIIDITSRATTSVYGLIKYGTATTTGISNTNSMPMLNLASANDIINNKDTMSYVSAVTNHNYVDVVRSVLPKTSTSVPTTLVAQTQYDIGVLSADISIAFPTTATRGEECYISFQTGATLPSITIDVSNVVGLDDFEPEINCIYEISCRYNGTAWIAVYSEVEVS